MRAYLELLRPANVVTALADVLAGFAVARLADRAALPWLLLATAALYAGGVVLNDFFDRDLDRVERPERPIPSGRVPAGRALALGVLLLAAGAGAAFAAGPVAGAVASAIAALVFLYDAWGRRHDAIAPVNMGLCRALNLLLGIAASPPALAASWPLGCVPFLYIAAVTMVSRGEVRGGGRGAAGTALLFLGVAWLALVFVAARTSPAGAAGALSGRWPALLLAAVLGWRVIPPFWRARRTPAPSVARRAVKRGVLSLVILDATIGAAYAGPVYAALVLATGVIAGMLARVFAVT